jgi:steroid 5-alpha reductase family enzyme
MKGIRLHQHWLVILTLLVTTATSSVNSCSAFVERSIMSFRNHNLHNDIKNYKVIATTKKQTSTPIINGRLRGGARMTSFDNRPFWAAQAAFAGINGAGWIINLFTHTHYHVDLFGTGAFAVAAALPGLFLNDNNKNNNGVVVAVPQRVQWSSTAVIVWSVKLASFLFARVIMNSKDARMDDILSHPGSSAGFWFVSFIWGAVCSLPHVLGATSNAVGNPVALCTGAAIFAAGWITETLADYQKFMFKKSNPGQFCNVGLWSLSQHPNWLGNLMLWSGIFVMNAPALVDTVPKSSTVTAKVWAYRRVGLALLSPMFLWLLFDGEAKGTVLPESHIAFLDRYGYNKDPTFTRYVDETPRIIPNPFQWFKGERS